MTDAERAAMREAIRLKTKCVQPITRSTFPLNQPVIVEAIIDCESGWEFDAPLHIMRPFHRYIETGSIWAGAVDSALEDILIDLSIGQDESLPPDDHAWPYTGKYLDRVFRQVRNGGRRDRFCYYRRIVLVTDWDAYKWEFFGVPGDKRAD